MATDRKSYFVVGDSIWREPWSLEVKGVLVNLMGLLNERWARDGLTPEEACRITLSDTLLMAVTQSMRLRSARDRLSIVARSVSIQVSIEGRNTTIIWPKYSVFQRYRARSQGNLKAETGPPHPHPHPHPHTLRSSGATEGEKSPEKEPVRVAGMEARRFEVEVVGFAEADAFFNSINALEREAKLRPTPFGHAQRLEAAPWFRNGIATAVWIQRAKNLVASRKNGVDLTRLFLSKKAALLVESMDAGPWTRDGEIAPSPEAIEKKRRVEPAPVDPEVARLAKELVGRVKGMPRVNTKGEESDA